MPRFSGMRMALRFGPPPDIVPPVFLTGTSASVQENDTLFFTITTNEACTIAITGGIDAAQFELATTSSAFSHVLRWAGDGVQDYEDPQDDDLDNFYEVEVTVTDRAGNTTQQNISIDVTDISDSPSSTWNSGDMTSNITLSNADLTATRTAFGDGGVRGTASRSSGKLYFEFTVGAINGGDTGAGIATSGANLSTIGGSAVGGLIAFTTNVYFNGSAQFSAGGLIPGSVVGFAIDLTNSLAWQRKDTGNWNNSGTANPATGVGGLNISALFPGSAAYAVFAGNFPGDNITLNVAGTFAHGPPSGFTAWG